MNKKRDEIGEKVGEGPPHSFGQLDRCNSVHSLARLIIYKEATGSIAKCILLSCLLSGSLGRSIEASGLKNWSQDDRYICTRDTIHRHSNLRTSTLQVDEIKDHFRKTEVAALGDITVTTIDSFQVGECWWTVSSLCIRFWSIAVTAKINSGAIVTGCYASIISSSVYPPPPHLPHFPGLIPGN